MNTEYYKIAGVVVGVGVVIGGIFYMTSSSSSYPSDPTGTGPGPYTDTGTTSSYTVGGKKKGKTKKGIMKNTKKTRKLKK